MAYDDRMALGTRRMLERLQAAGKVPRCQACGHLIAADAGHSCSDAVAADSEQAEVLLAWALWSPSRTAPPPPGDGDGAGRSALE